MSERAPRRGSAWPAALLVAAALGVLIVSVAGASSGRLAAEGPERTSTARRAEPITLRPALAGVASTADEADRARPTRLVVPDAGVDTRLVPLGLLPDGAMEVPQDAAVAGWYEPGPAPGEVGSAVLAGHVDSKRAPGVFFHLAGLRPGDPITVERDDGRQFVFSVTAVEQHPKSALPADRIWAPTSEPTLRLVTCGGTFDRRTRHYTDNVVVFAELRMVTEPQARLRDA